jgi:hypothetical protein
VETNPSMQTMQTSIMSTDPVSNGWGERWDKFAKKRLPALVVVIDFAKYPLRSPLLELLHSSPLRLIGQARNRIASGLVRFRGIQSGWNNKCMKNIIIWIRIYSRSKINLPIMIGRTRDRRAGLVPHPLTSGLIPSLLEYLS